MAKCYICGDNSKGTCIYCNKPICSTHLVLVGGNSACTKCLHRGKKIGLIAFPFILLLIIIILVVGYLFYVSRF
ncbi:MAG: hypothetical protein ACFFHV_18715 [Promethearchaeota archaeon]